MIKYRIDTDTWSSEELTDFNAACGRYEMVKDRKMGDGVNEDSFVELVSSEDDFEDYEVLKRSVVVIDQERMMKSTPREEGRDFDYWAKWEELSGLSAEKGADHDA